MGDPFPQFAGGRVVDVFEQAQGADPELDGSTAFAQCDVTQLLEHLGRTVLGFKGGEDSAPLLAAK